MGFFVLFLVFVVLRVFLWASDVKRISKLQTSINSNKQRSLNSNSAFEQIFDLLFSTHSARVTSNEPTADDVSEAAAKEGKFKAAWEFSRSRQVTSDEIVQVAENVSRIKSRLRQISKGHFITLIKRCYFGAVRSLRASAMVIAFIRVAFLVTLVIVFAIFLRNGFVIGPFFAPLVFLVLSLGAYLLFYPFDHLIESRIAEIDKDKAERCRKADLLRNGLIRQAALLDSLKLRLYSGMCG